MAGVSHDLIDTTEMYLRTIFELVEEGVVPMRARLAERLAQSGPTVSQTVARMQRDGLVDVATGDRRLELTEEGRRQATRVMRKHRLAECLLIDVIGLDWEQVHEEACRWEHVISDAVERRVLQLLDHPTHSPYGNPIPGLDELGDVDPHEQFLEGLVRLPVAAAGAVPVTVRVSRIGEPVQYEPGTLAVLSRCGLRPGATLTAWRGAEGVVVRATRLGEDGASSVEHELSLAVAAHVFVAIDPVVTLRA